MVEQSGGERLDAVFGALSDPTRRAILALLRDRDANVGDIASRFPISLNGVSKHLRVLERAGLVARDVRGREHRLRLDAVPLGDAAAWLAHYGAFWNERLDALDALLTNPQTPRPAPRRRQRS